MAVIPSLIRDDEAFVRRAGAFAIALEPMAHDGSLPETNDERAIARRYVSLEALARVTDTPTARLPAMDA